MCQCKFCRLTTLCTVSTSPGKAIWSPWEVVVSRCVCGATTILKKGEVSKRVRRGPKNGFAMWKARLCTCGVCWCGSGVVSRTSMRGNMMVGVRIGMETSGLRTRNSMDFYRTKLGHTKSSPHTGQIIQDRGGDSRIQSDRAPCSSGVLET